MRKHSRGEEVILHTHDPGFVPHSTFGDSDTSRRGARNVRGERRGPAKRRRQTEDTGEDLDFRAVRREVMDFGATGFSHVAKKEHDARRVIALGGKAPKNPKVPIKILRGMQAKLKQRNDQAQEEYLTNRVSSGVLSSRALQMPASGKGKRSGLFYMEQFSPLDLERRKKAKKFKEARSLAAGRDGAGLLTLGHGKDLTFSGGVLKVRDARRLTGGPSARGRRGRGRGSGESDRRRVRGVRSVAKSMRKRRR